MKVLALREQFDHMGAHSGYDQLFDPLRNLVDLQFVWRDQKTNNSEIYQALPSWLLRSKGMLPIPHSFSFLAETLFGRRFQDKVLYHMLNYLQKTSSPFYYLPSILGEVRLIEALEKKNYDIVHLSYVENHFGLLGSEKVRQKMSSALLIGTVHQSLDWWLENGNIDALKSFDAIIVLAEHERERWEEYIPDKIHHISHGVDTDFFVPSNQKNPNFSCVFSGYWYRDFDSLGKAIDLILARDQQIRFDLILPSNRLEELKSFIDQFQEYPQVFFHTDVTDHKLREIYQSSNVMILPLSSCTANNALLEGLACGLPIVTTDLENILTYVTSDEAILTEVSSPELLSSSVLSLKDDPKLQASMSRHARNRAMDRFRWTHIANQQYILYQSLISTNKNQL
jgi:glycosyltransferase involved in cell wall biosynthesis